MSDVILVLGATGQQGGATARALVRDGWKVRALVRDPAKAKNLEGVELVRGDFRDEPSLERAMQGVYGVFSVQPSSGQPEYGVTDEDETRFGKRTVDFAKAAGVRHFVYTSVSGLKPGSGIGHFESKWNIEEYVRASGLRATIVRPATFMEYLTAPFFGLAQKQLTFFSKPEQNVQLISVNDIGVLVAKVFADADAFAGKAIELAGDEMTGTALAASISRATGETVPFSRFPDAMIAQVPLLQKLVAAVDRGDLNGSADVASLRKLHPQLETVDAWLKNGGAEQIRATFK